ncbi:hypothetical protein [Lacisediminihabitans changchengi]|uniref:S1 family peptidase n=1 Tax=Lacisediminihabitans changchengi TaxID=2787634 RepID=A0A934SKP0_9MICO|nr:hypothetical protein [Lacisediminihabitans changchengi]MBK4347095.1 hypothetical protein [Lacisediminihabitans changchengi]MBK4347782.1 hypothetical protein [Lacisediminihabitans changchengi]
MKHTNAGLPAGTELQRGLPENATSIIPDQVRLAVAELKASSHRAQLNDFRWDASTQTLNVYVNGDPEAVKGILAKSLSADQKSQIVSASTSKAALSKLIEGLADQDGTMANGQQLVTATPSSDGSTVTIAVDADASTLRDLSARKSQVGGVQLRYESAGAVTPTLRQRNDAPVFTGGLMTGQGYNCTTGFPVIRSDGEYGNVSADHCGHALNGTWYWGYSGNAVHVGTTSGTAGGGSDFEIFRGTTDPSGYTLVGPYNVSNQVAPIVGYYASIAGDQVCYNGSYSGTVCGNDVVETSVYTCYEGLQCYWLTRTHNSVPAVGNGDSGGPVMGFAAAADGSTEAYGTGIVSGIIDGTATCTGEPGGTGANDRKCSKDVLFAPIETFVNNNLSFSLLGV